MKWRCPKIVRVIGFEHPESGILYSSIPFVHSKKIEKEKVIDVKTSL